MDVRELNEVEVYHNSKLVGFLSSSQSGYVFVYASEWIEKGFSISPFKLPLSKEVFVCNDYLTNYMFGVFSDCLPDSWGNRLVDKFLVQNGINPQELSLLQRLTLLNDSSLGSLSFKPRILSFKNKEDIITFDNLYSKIRKFLKDDEIDDVNLLSLYHHGSSTGGSRPKVNVRIENSECIVKFPGKLDPDNIGVEEYRLNELAKKCGLNVEECKLIPSKINGGYFAAKRFDREEKKRKHIISLAGLFDLEPNLSQIHYLGFLQTVNALCPEDLDEAIGRMVFNYLIGNKDDHPRNFSFIYDEENNKYRLAPFYDITSTPLIKEHMMQVNGVDEPTIDDFITIVKKVGKTKEEFLRIYNRIFLITKEYKF